MPYIRPKDRKRVVPRHQTNGFKKVVAVEDIVTAGELQYAIAEMIKSYIQNHGLNYQICNDIMGALAGAQMEFYRRTVAPYEDKKIEENGDV